MTQQQLPVFKRVLLKLSGEALTTNEHSTFDFEELNALVAEIAAIHQLGVQIAIVVGGGNILRGRSLDGQLDSVTADQMGMLSTITNALALQDIFEQKTIPTSLLSAWAIDGVVDCFQSNNAIRSLNKGNIVILAAGTGNPLATTDSAASLRGIEIKADILLKATTHVDGVYSSDPREDPSARFYTHLTFNQALKQNLGIMDIAAFSQCRDYDLPIQVFNIKKQGALLRVILGEPEGTIINKGEVND